MSERDFQDDDFCGGHPFTAALLMALAAIGIASVIVLLLAWLLLGDAPSFLIGWFE